MPEENIIDEVIDDKTVLSWFHELYNESNNGIFSKNLEEKCKILMKVLPPLPQGLGDIDDIIYYEYVKPNDVAKEIQFGNEVLHHIYINLRYYYRLKAGSPGHYSAYVTFLKILHLAPKHMFDDLKRGDVFIQICRRAANDLMFGDLKRCCRAMKLFRVISMKDKHSLTDILSEGDQTFIMHLPEYRDLLSAKHPDKNRLTTWMSNQASILINDSVLINRNILFDESRDVLKTLLEQNEFENYIFYLTDMYFFYNNLKSYFGHSFVHHYEYVHNYFSSAKNYEEKIERIKAFINGSLKYAKTWSSPEEWLKHNRNRRLELKYEYRFLGLAKDIVQSFVSCYLLNAKQDQTFRKIIKLHPITIKPYLSEDDVYHQIKALNIANGNVLEQINDGYEATIVDGEDLTIEKYLFYDKFVKHLEVYNFVEEDERMVFNACDSSFSTHIEHVLEEHVYTTVCTCRYARDNLLMRVATKNCPYLFLGRHQQHLADDLLKLVAGEKLSDDTFEELFYAVHSSTNGFTPVHVDDKESNSGRRR